MNGQPSFSQACTDVLALLTMRRNVLISGAPATGKSRLLNEIALAFSHVANPGGAVPVHVPGERVAIPATPPIALPASQLPSPERTNREVFHTAFHQGSKYRDFVSGLVPRAGSAEVGFVITSGTLYRASEHAKRAEGASLLIIDEINRGPAVQVFGGSIVAIEADKRLAADGSRLAETTFFELLSPETSGTVEYALPAHLYIVAAMNQADASVEPLDVAFLRRWAPYRLVPDAAVLRAYFGLPAESEIPPAPATVTDVYEAAVQAWQAVNRRIRVGRGAEFEIGHGIYMNGPSSASSDMDRALSLVAQCWEMIITHIGEVFFGDALAIAATLNASESAGRPYHLAQVMFADDPHFEIEGPTRIDADNVYEVLRSVIL